MSTKPGRDHLRIVAMIQAAEEARRDSPGRKDEFLNGGLAQKAVLLDLIHPTESAEKASPGLKKRTPRIPWQRLSQLRNRGLVHDYLGPTWKTSGHSCVMNCLD
jgi:uncharacterized protein with HEPN domain